MMVVDTESAYNVIIRRSWLNEIRIVISNSQLNFKFPNGNRVEVIKSKQKVARSYYVEATKEMFTTS